jgi:mRNA interferase RelE/StbE
VTRTEDLESIEATLELLADTQAQQRIACVEFLYGPLVENPQRVAAPLRKPFDGYWRARRGEYRVRYTIDDSSQTVQVLDISRRRDAYR